MGDAASVTMLVLDVDGVLTDGSIALDANGLEIKRYNIKDGLGLRLWRDAGFEIAIITGRGGGSVRARCAELGIERVVEKAADKAAAIRQLGKETSVPLEHMAYIGDDWNDLPAIALAGFTFAPADAEAEVRERVDVVCEREGGRGAVRDAVTHLLRSRGLLAEQLSRYQA